MGKYILKRTGMMAIILFLIVSIAFFVLRLMPGSPYDDDQDLTPEAIEALNANQLFEELPETYTIFVTENDIYGFGDGIYPIERVIVTHEQLFNDRAHILYVNGAYRGNDPLGELMHDFCCNDPDDMKNEMLAEASRYYKENPKGVEIMCKVIEEMREEVEERTMLNAIKNIMEGLKYTAQQAMELLKIPADDQPKYLAKL